MTSVICIAFTSDLQVIVFLFKTDVSQSSNSPKSLLRIPLTYCVELRIVNKQLFSPTPLPFKFPRTLPFLNLYAPVQNLLGSTSLSLVSERINEKQFCLLTACYS